MQADRKALDFGEHKHVLLSGATGFIGSALCRELLAAGHKVTVISRRPVKAARQFEGKVEAIASANELLASDAIDLIINLAGAPVIGPLWTTRRKAVLLRSRLDTTRQLLDFVKRAELRPTTWIQASAIGFYGTQRSVATDEQAAAGSGFAAELCSSWEHVTEDLEALGLRRVILRFGMIFGRSGGALPLMSLPFRFALGSVLGDGKQPVNWMHLDDLLQLLAWAARDASCQGIFNAVAPEAPTYREFAQLIGQTVRRPVFIRVPAAPLRLVLGEMASMLLDGPVVEPGELQRVQFEYQFPNLRSALMDILGANKP